MTKCPKCGSKEIGKGNLTVWGQFKGSVYYAPDKQKGIFTKGPKIKSYVCNKCGYLETYADVPELNKIIGN